MEENTDNSQKIPQQNSQENASEPSVKRFAILMVIIIIVAVVGTYLYLDGEGIEGKWNFESAVFLNADGSVNQTATVMMNSTEDEELWMEFRSDGVLRMGGIDNVEPIEYLWSVNEDKINLVDPWGTHMEWTYEINGDTLTIENHMFGITLRMVLVRA